MDASQEYKTVTLTLIFGHHLRLGASMSDHKWKMYMEVDCEDDSECDPLMCVKHVTFSPSGSTDVIKISQVHIDDLMQKRCNSSALAMELHLFCIQPSIWFSNLVMLAVSKIAVEK